MTWWGMVGNGPKIAGTTATRERRAMERLGQRETVVVGFCAAVRGMTTRGSFALHSATGSAPASATSTSASVLARTLLAAPSKAPTAAAKPAQRKPDEEARKLAMVDDAARQTAAASQYRPLQYVRGRGYALERDRLFRRVEGAVRRMACLFRQSPVRPRIKHKAFSENQPTSTASMRNTSIQTGERSAPSTTSSRNRDLPWFIQRGGLQRTCWQVTRRRVPPGTFTVKFYLNGQYLAAKKFKVLANAATGWTAAVAGPSMPTVPGRYTRHFWEYALRADCGGSSGASRLLGAGHHACAERIASTGRRLD